MKKKYEQKESMWRKQKIRDRRHHDFDQRDSIVLRTLHVSCYSTLIIFLLDSMRNYPCDLLRQNKNNSTIMLIIIIT